MNASSGWLVLLAVVIAAAITTIAQRGTTAESAATTKSSRSEVPSQPRTQHPVVINRPQGAPRLATGKVDPLGREITLSCASCHANRASNRATRQGSDLKEFHQGLQCTHGTLRCVSCHNPVDYNSLRLADGRSLSFVNVQSLCSQCHAPQVNDYEHGAHGGMNGHWDLSRGPRQRKGCIDCHDPHAPAFPGMVPTFKSRDRFLAPSHAGTTHE